MEPFELLDAVHAGFSDRLDQVRPDQWDLPTPCSEWDVRSLVGHVVKGARYYVRLFQGSSRDDAWTEMEVASNLVLGSDPVASYLQNEAAFRSALTTPGALGRLCHHQAGDISGEQLLGARVSDVAIHTWDLARAVSLDEQLPEPVIAMVWEMMEPWFASGQVGPYYAPPNQADDKAATLQIRLLRASGRTP